MTNPRNDRNTRGKRQKKSQLFITESNNNQIVHHVHREAPSNPETLITQTHKRSNKKTKIWVKKTTDFFDISNPKSQYPSIVSQESTKGYSQNDTIRETQHRLEKKNGQRGVSFSKELQLKMGYFRQILYQRIVRHA